MKPIVGVCCILLFLIIFFSCEKDPFPPLPPKVETTHELALPIGTFSANLKKVSNIELPVDLLNKWYNDTALLNSFDDFVMTGSVPFEGSTQIGNQEKVEKILFHLYVNNEFPSDLDLKLYYGIETSLDSSISLKVGKSTINTDGSLKSLQKIKKVFELDKEKIGLLANSKEIQISLILSKPADIKILKHYDKYFVNLEMGVEIVVHNTFFSKK